MIDQDRMVTEFFPEWCWHLGNRTKTVANLKQLGIVDDAEHAWRISFGGDAADESTLTFPMKFAREQDAAQAARVLNQTPLVDMSVSEILNHFAELDNVRDFVRLIAESLAF